jgi:hypothetical protein
MKKLLRVIVSFSLVLFLVPVLANAGEMIEITCTKPGDTKKMVFDIDSSGGKQNIAAMGESEVTFSKKKIIVKFGEGTASFNITNGTMHFNGEDHGITCKYDNLAALENESVPSASLKVDEGEVIKLLKSIASRLDRIEEMLSK